VNLDNSEEVFRHFTPFDLKRLSSYSQNLLDYHVIMDLLPKLANFYFMNRLERKAQVASESSMVKLSAVQSAIIAGVGLQKKTIDDLQKDLEIPVSQILALLGKSVRKASGYLNSVVEMGIEKEITDENEKAKKELSKKYEQGDKKSKALNDEEAWDPLSKSLNEDLDEAGKEELKNYSEKQREIINNLDLSNFKIGGTDEDWENVKINGGSNIVSIKNPESKKKRKLQKDLAANLASKHSGEGTGIYDPKGLINKKKSKKKLRK
jgi:N-acetyltransferase 10